jgi:DNA (cytosine-5)-methyltransferase 1
VLTMLDLFSGIGGFSLAASWTGGIKTVMFCENEPYCQKVLKKHWPDIPIHDDIRTLRGEDVGTVDIVCGGFPCQPFSCAGKRRGKEDDRYLWPEMFRVIQETKPTWVVGENVAGLIYLALEDCFIDLEGAGYEVQPFIIPACGVGAPHRRDRVWIIANTQSNTMEKQKMVGQRDHLRQIQKQSGRMGGAQWSAWTDNQPPMVGMDDGVPDWVDRSKALGNAIVPQVVYPVFQAIVDIEEGTK